MVAAAVAAACLHYVVCVSADALLSLAQQFVCCHSEMYLASYLSGAFALPSSLAQLVCCHSEVYLSHRCVSESVLCLHHLFCLRHDLPLVFQLFCEPLNLCHSFLYPLLVRSCTALHALCVLLELRALLFPFRPHCCRRHF